MKRLRIAGLLITNFTNVTYLTGFTGDDSYLFISKDRAVIFSDPRYEEQLAAECPEFPAIIRRPGQTMAEQLATELKRCHVTSLGIEAASMNVALYERLKEALPGSDVVPTHGLVEALREIKDRAEIERIRDAVRLAEKALAVVRASLIKEQTEKQIADEIEFQMRRFGASAASFPPIAAVGPNAALPHARPGTRKLGNHGLLLIDWGASLRGYVSDLTRVLVTDKISPKLERIYRVVLRAQQAAIEAICPGVTAHDVDRTARGIIEQEGFGRFFGHSLGHGIGLEVHEGPRLAPNQHRPLKRGMVVTVEPGIYLPGVGGVRIEDDVLVTRGGHEVLSRLDGSLEAAITEI